MHFQLGNNWNFSMLSLRWAVRIYIKNINTNKTLPQDHYIDAVLYENDDHHRLCLNKVVYPPSL